MSETFNTHQVWLTKKSGSLLVGGKVYYGVVNGDPVNVQGDRIKIFSDRALTTELPNPISTGDDGRTAVNGVPAKVWVGERHSIFVLDRPGVEQFQDLDRGETPGTGAPIVLSNVQGTNAITAEAPGGLTGYIDGQIYIFKAANTNTAIIPPFVSLKIEGAPELAKPIKFNSNEEIKAGFFQAKQNIEVMYNSTGNAATDHFSWLNSGRGISILTNVLGDGNTITADGGPSTEAYVDGQIYQFKPNDTNSEDVTLKIGTRPANSIKSQGIELPSGTLKSNIPYLVSYNSIGTVFELLNFGVELLSFNSGFQSMQTFTANGTWNRPAEIDKIIVIAVGGGGGGGATASVIAGGGGGTGATALSVVSSPSSSYVIVIGTGGSAGSSGSGGTGTITTVGETVVIAGAGVGGGADGAGGLGGGTGTADVLIVGGDGQSSQPSGTSSGGNGGASFFGGGGRGGTTTLPPAAGRAFGSGGGGAFASGLTGGAAKGGLVIILEFVSSVSL